MKTKRKEKEKKRRKQNKRSEEITVVFGIELRTFGASGLSFTTRPRGTHGIVFKILSLKPLSLIKRDFKDTVKFRK